MTAEWFNFAKWFDNVCQSALGHRSSQEQTYDLARLVLQRNIPGDFVECGVYAGASCALMARAIMDYNIEEYGEELGTILKPVPRVHLFDSFARIPKPGPHDYELRSNVGGESACSLEDVQANMQRWEIADELLVYHVGEFAVKVPIAAQLANCYAHYGFAHGVALLRLDGDLYESTRVCMEHLYPLVSPGGYVIVDDFNLSGCRKAVMEFMEDQIAPVVWRRPK